MVFRVNSAVNSEFAIFRNSMKILDSHVDWALRIPCCIACIFHNFCISTVVLCLAADFDEDQRRSGAIEYQTPIERRNAFNEQRNELEKSAHLLNRTLSGKSGATHSRSNRTFNLTMRRRSPEANHRRYI